MGSLMVKVLQSRINVRIVGAIDKDPNKIGKDLGEVCGLNQNLGVEISFPASNVLKKTSADIVLLATTAFLEDLYPFLLEIIENNLNVITITQELVFPIGQNKKIAKNIDTLAKQHEVSITAVGINPGFIMDLIPIVASYPCWNIDKIEVYRNVDFSPYGPDEMIHIGAGLTIEEFQKGVEKGEIGHIGLLESAHMVAECLEIPLDGYRQEKIPLISKKKRKTAFITINSNEVYGFKQNVYGFYQNKDILTFKMIGILDPDPSDGVHLGDHTIITGTPNVDIAIKHEISQKGGIGTAAVAVNIIPRILEAPYGYHPFIDLHLPHYWSGKPREL